MTIDEIKEAYETIKKFGIDPDTFIQSNFQMYLVDGEPSDNSCDLYSFHKTQLEIIIKLGLYKAKELIDLSENVSLPDLKIEE